MDIKNQILSNNSETTSTKCDLPLRIEALAVGVHIWILEVPSHGAMGAATLMLDNLLAAPAATIQDESWAHSAHRRIWLAWRVNNFNCCRPSKSAMGNVSSSQSCSCRHDSRIIMAPHVFSRSIISSSSSPCQDFSKNLKNRKHKPCPHSSRFPSLQSSTLPACLVRSPVPSPPSPPQLPFLLRLHFTEPPPSLPRRRIPASLRVPKAKASTPSSDGTCLLAVSRRHGRRCIACGAPDPPQVRVAALEDCFLLELQS